MAKPASGPRVLTANRLHDGAVVYLTADGAWTEYLTHAAVAQGDALDALQQIAAKAAADNLVVDAVVIVADLSLRERIRRDGPTVRPDLARGSEV